MIDGAMARTRNQISDLGKVLDPIADKLLFFFTATLLLPKFNRSGLLLMVVGLEILTLVISGTLMRKGRDISANIMGKAKMFLQVIALMLFIIANSRSSQELAFYGSVLLYISLVFTAASILYFLLKK